MMREKKMPVGTGILELICGGAQGPALRADDEARFGTGPSKWVACPVTSTSWQEVL